MATPFLRDRMIMAGARSCAFLSVHDEAAGDVDCLTSHIRCPLGSEEADDMGYVLRSLHAAKRHLGGTLCGEVLGRQAHQSALLTSHRHPHVGLHEAGADAVY